MKETKDLEIFLNGKKVIVKNIEKTRIFGKFKGLMFNKKNNSKALLFENSKSQGIHSFFVFFDFLCVWLDKDNDVIDFRIVKPFNPYVKTDRYFDKILEIPKNSFYKETIDMFSKL
ncbi:MAG: hypothetical protein AABX03_03205 [Nanoarchaeota archaeon]